MLSAGLWRGLASALPGLPANGGAPMTQPAGLMVSPTPTLPLTLTLSVAAMALGPGSGGVQGYGRGQGMERGEQGLRGGLRRQGWWEWQERRGRGRGAGSAAGAGLCLFQLRLRCLLHLQYLLQLLHLELHL